MFHSAPYTNQKLRRLLGEVGVTPETFVLANISGRPARTKGKVSVDGNKVTVFMNDCIVKGFIKD